jgi:hypothetical protein
MHIMCKIMATFAFLFYFIIIGSVLHGETFEICVLAEYFMSNFYDSVLYPEDEGDTLIQNSDQSPTRLHAVAIHITTVCILFQFK